MEYRPTTRETGKQRATRIPLDYYKKTDPLIRWRGGLSALALLLVVGWLATGLSLGSNGLGSIGLGKARYSHGTLARAHATWDNKCEACHVSFKPISTTSSWAGAFGADPKAADAKCMTCHMGTPRQAHHPDTEVTGEAPACAGCHRDHRGRDASLVRLTDKDCTSCHAKLKDHLQSGQDTDYRNVESFVGDLHPQFRLF